MPLLIKDALQQARSHGVDRLDAQLLLLHVCSGGVEGAAGAEAGRKAGRNTPPRSRSWLLSHDDQALTPPQAAAWHSGLRRRAAGEPLAYVLGEQLFCGLALQVSPAVLIPRPETEGLVDWALECLQAGSNPAPRVLDLGTGSGAIALALKHRRPQAQVFATDISAGALAVAMANAGRLGLEVGFSIANWWAPVAEPAVPEDGAQPVRGDTSEPALPATLGPSGGRFDLVVSNPPYITDGDPHLDALRHEPRSALVGRGMQGLGDLRTIIQGASQRLAPGGWLLLEHGHDQGPAVLQLLQQAGFRDTQTRTDLGGLPRCSGGRRDEKSVA